MVYNPKKCSYLGRMFDRRGLDVLVAIDKKLKGKVKLENSEVKRINSWIRPQ